MCPARGPHKTEMRGHRERVVDADRGPAYLSNASLDTLRVRGTGANAVVHLKNCDIGTISVSAGPSLNLALVDFKGAVVTIDARDALGSLSIAGPDTELKHVTFTKKPCGYASVHSHPGKALPAFRCREPADDSKLVVTDCPNLETADVAVFRDVRLVNLPRLARVVGGGGVRLQVGDCPELVGVAARPLRAFEIRGVHAPIHLTAAEHGSELELVAMDPAEGFVVVDERAAVPGFRVSADARDGVYWSSWEKLWRDATRAPPGGALFSETVGAGALERLLGRVDAFLTEIGMRAMVRMEPAIVDRMREMRTRVVWSPRERAFVEPAVETLDKIRRHGEFEDETARSIARSVFLGDLVQKAFGVALHPGLTTQQ